MKKVVIIGTGYVGLPLAIVLARKGFQVVGVDIDENIISAINNGVLTIKEKELNKIFQEKVVKKNLKGSTIPCRADIFVIAVPTPLLKRKKQADLSFVIDGLHSILPFLRKGNLIIVESTIPPLTCMDVITPIIEENTKMEVGSDIYLAHCPERILPGDVFNEIVQNDRIIGGVNSESNKIALEMYSSFVEGEIYETDDVTAELCKLVENTYRDVNIALSNELSFVADTLNLDIGQVIALANKHPRVNMLNPGIGVGGHCIPLDPWFITEVDPNNTVLIQTARRLNDNIPNLVARKIRRILSGINSPKIIALGLAYKPNTSDTRESPAIQIIDSLITDGYHVDSYDPLVEGKEYISLKEIAKGSDCIIVLVEHDIILKNIRDDYEEIIKVLKSNIILNSQCKSLMESNDDMLN
tara:strand:+ start:952 stop:2190 length:1239 start_codon:yes stop_codon:yes gene_type:complete